MLLVLLKKKNDFQFFLMQIQKGTGTKSSSFKQLFYNPALALKILVHESLIKFFSVTFRIASNFRIICYCLGILS